LSVADGADDVPRLHIVSESYDMRNLKALAAIAAALFLGAVAATLLAGGQPAKPKGKPSLHTGATTDASPEISIPKAEIKDEKPADEKSADEKASTDDKPVEKAAEDKKGDEKSSDDKPAEAKSARAKRTEQAAPTGVVAARPTAPKVAS